MENFEQLALAGKPGAKSIKPSGFCPVARLNESRKQKKLTECLQILENQGIQGELAIFALSLADDGGEG